MRCIICKNHFPFYRFLFILLFQSSSVTQSCLTLCNPIDCSTPGLPVHHQLPEFPQTHVHWVDDAIQPSHPLRPLFLLSLLFPSIRAFSNESVLCIRWPKFWSFSVRPSNEYSGLISFRMDWMDLLAVRGTLKSLLQHHRLKAGREGNNRGGDGWMASSTQWTWVWVSSRSRWCTGKPGVLQSMG